jgi:hypothetical protein
LSKAQSGHGPVARHIEERLPLVVRFGLFGPVKALYGVLAILIG